MVPTLVRLVLPRLQIEPRHRLLEIGCGNGTAVAAVADRLSTGSILAIDRSGAAVARAARRNADHIARGVARIEHADLSQLAVPVEQFDTAFALNVNLFQARGTAAQDAIRRCLRRGGRLVLAYRRPDARHLAARADQISVSLVAGGFVVTTVEWLGPIEVCLVAAPA